MKQVVDLHIHSKYSRACSPQLDLEHIAWYCQIKGVQIVATGDFTYPQWFVDIKEKLVPQNQGIYVLKKEYALPAKIKKPLTKFVLATELSLVYKDKGKTRRIHLVVLAPCRKAVEKFNAYLENHNYNIRSDGRPILGMSAPQLCQILWEIDENFMVIPAHIWTPWFAVFGSKSGFDSLEECFEKYTNRIYAIETGLSSDPEMNWLLPQLDKITLVSNSDAHSLPNIGREANVFEMKENTYAELQEIIKTRKNFLYTIEFYPEEGMYHYDGHRDCGVSFSPEETKKLKGICPVCQRPLTIGVMNRVRQLASPDRQLGFKPKGAIPFVKAVELDKIIAESKGIKSRQSKKVQDKFWEIIGRGYSELEILLDVPLAELEKIIQDEKIVLGIKRMRQGELEVKPGFDGQYGEVKIFSAKDFPQQKTLL